MELFIYGTTICMVMETPLKFNLESAMDKIIKTSDATGMGKPRVCLTEFVY